jgi:2-polyprenyl-3-methyl-5-hydroxy-6-metoxy-1,4-benzoquinol methylase
MTDGAFPAEVAMRLAVRADTLVERLALWLRLVPTPAADAWGGMALSSVVITATRLGLFAQLAAEPATTAALADGLALDPTVSQLLLDCLAAAGYVTGPPGGPYRLSRVAGRWLDPAAPLSVANFVAANQDYWSWWASLDDVARTGRTESHHGSGPDDPYWRRYILGQRDLARLSAAYVAKKVPVPRGPRRLLDLGGGHGLYSVELCRRHPDLTVTVLDLPGSAAIGREIVAGAGLADRVGHVDGDVRTADFGGPYDVVLCFNLVHHLRPDEVAALFGRARSALVPGGTLAVMDAFAVPSQRGAAAATVLNLFTYLSSGVAGYTPAQLHTWFAEAGFAAARRVPIRRIPGQAMFLAANA